MVIHELKVNKEFFEKILSGDKNYEVRLGDTEYQIGDTIKLLEKDPLTKELTGRSIDKLITIISNTKNVTYWPKEDIEKFGLKIIGFK